MGRKRKRIPYSEHHIIPVSRYRKSEYKAYLDWFKRKHYSRKKGATVRLPAGFHLAWHSVFGNLYDDEIIQFIVKLQKMFWLQEVITSKELEALREMIKRGERYGQER
ncbi:MAG: hypothetical protein ACTSQA_08890 [Candidatus Heimdallarchaeaceae archaeon]